MAERQKIIETNRSLRLIKNELESLLEKGVIGDDVFDSVSRLLPAESSLSSAGTPASRTAAFPTPATSTASPASPQPPAAGFANLNLHHNNNEPPAYSQQSTTPAAQTQHHAPPPPPPGPPGKPVIAHARALYKYAASDARDCSFDRDDRIAVHEYMNADWWMGRNLRTGSEGIFPKNYVEVEAAPPPPGPPQMTPAGYPVDEKAGYNGYQPPAQQQYGGGYPPPPGQQNPYNSSVPPMAVAEQGSGAHGQAGGDGKVGEYGKKFGKKLGNAAIFGAGATIGGNIVNSIF